MKNKAIIWDETSQGMKFEYVDIPAELLRLRAEWREKMVEAAAGIARPDEQYLENGSLSEKQGHRRRCVSVPWLAKFSRCCVVPRSRTRVFS